MARPTTPIETSSGIDIDAWTSSTAASMARLSLTPASAIPPDSPIPIRSRVNAAADPAAGSSPSLNLPHPNTILNVDASAQPGSHVRGTTALHIPLDELSRTSRPQPHLATSAQPQPHLASTRNQPQAPTATASQPLRRKSSNRDSLRRRETLLIGKPGTRRRRQYENSRLISNPYAVPPEPSDWEIRPTYAHKDVPYAAAGLWDEKYKLRAGLRVERERQEKEDGKRGLERLSRVDRERLKRCGARGLVQDLEVIVREFVEDWERKTGKKDDAIDGGRGRGDSFVNVGNASEETLDSSDEEVVFVGRRALSKSHMHDDVSRRKAKEQEMREEKLVLDSLEDDSGARFRRWLVHAIAQYYDLRAWSVTTHGDPAHREAYVGIKRRVVTPDVKTRNKIELPRPLWVMV